MSSFRKIAIEKLSVQIHKQLEKLGLRITSIEKYKKMSELLKYPDAISRWSNEEIPRELSNFIFRNLSNVNSKAQLQQDLLALYFAFFNQSSNKYFVEFGASNGVEYSNTYLLEKEFGFKGILCEPARSCIPQLLKNRECVVEFACVWCESNKYLSFEEQEEVEYSTISGISPVNKNAKVSNIYEVQTISLNDLLVKHNAPQKISYLSVDTEGSELEILRSFTFDYYEFDFISIEHNYRNEREEMRLLLSENGYHNILRGVSEFDDWFISDSMAQKHLLR